MVFVIMVFVFGVVVCVVVGMFNGFMIIVFCVFLFIVMLVMMMMVSGLVFCLINGCLIFELLMFFGWLGGDSMLNVLYFVIFMVGFYIVVNIVMLSMVVGRYIYVIGGNLVVVWFVGVFVK